ncbi:CCA tRNA nucleotidyltransferase [Candidatus Peribacteria bacterium]|nr:CCA tRNA nucleotidyltransferase [Candidatus Peribacteria bacterium]
MQLFREIIDRTLATKEGEAGYSVTETLMDAGYDCYWVGGAVRDMLLLKLPADIDMAVSAKPTDIMKLFPKSDGTAAELGSVVVSVKGQTFELTTYRSDHDIVDARRPESVRFGTRDDDALRRDATINAMYWNPVSRELFDPCKGEADLKERLVRFIGEPNTRIKEDALRILRLVRLRSLIDGQYHPETYAALKNNAALAATLSGTRILEELEKLLKLPKPSKALIDLLELGVLPHVLPELAACRGVAQPVKYHLEGDVWNHLMQCADAFTEDHGADTRIAALFHDIGKPKTFSLTDRIHFDEHAKVSSDIATSILERLKMPRTRIEKISWVIEHHMMMGSFKTLSDERKAHWYFHPWFQELLQVMYLDIAGTTPSGFSLYDEIIGDYDEFLNSHPRPEKPLLKGEEVMKLLSIESGEQVGKALKALHDAQVRKEVTTKAEAKEFLKKLIRISQK